MIEIVTTDQVQIANFVAKQIRGLRSYKDFGEFTAVGFLADGRLIGGAVFTGYTGHDITITVGGTSHRWINRTVFAHLAELVFRRWGCLRLTAVCARPAKRARKFAEKAGFKEEGVTRKGFDGKYDAVRYGMLKRECRWLKEVETVYGA
jgi:RimJ/RimL family protein N-acetyltransferase